MAKLTLPQLKHHLFAAADILREYILNLRRGQNFLTLNRPFHKWEIELGLIQNPKIFIIDLSLFFLFFRITGEQFDEILKEDPGGIGSFMMILSAVFVLLMPYPIKILFPFDQKRSRSLIRIGRQKAFETKTKRTQTGHYVRENQPDRMTLTFKIIVC